MPLCPNVGSQMQPFVKRLRHLFFLAVARPLVNDQEMSRRVHSEQLRWHISAGDHLLLIWRRYEPSDILQVVEMEANAL